MRRWILGLALALSVLHGPARAVQPDEVLADAKLEGRARAISSNLRCLVCQNESIDDSGADLARDLRLLVRRRLEAGDSDAQVRDFIVARYGDFVLLKPPVRPETALLWGMPVLVLGAGALGLYLARRRGFAQPEAAAPLNAQEQAELQRLVGPGER